MHRRITLAATALLATTALLLTACTGGGTEPSPSSSGTPDAAATLTVGLLLEPSNLDIRHQSGAALEQALIDNVYEGLVTRDADAGNEIVPRLASDWEVSSDGLTYTFTIRDDVTFHDGTPMTSADVVSSLTAAKDDETIQGHADLQGVATIEAPDATTVVITLTEPNSNFLFNLTGRAGLVVKTGDTTDLKTAANGTGPFTVGTWLQGDSLTLERNDAYWGDPAGVAEVVLTYFADSTAAVNAALEGSVDVVTEVDPELAPQLEGDVGYTLVSGETTDKGTLAFNNKKAPLDDVRVREALRLAIDHDALIETLGSGDTLFGPIPPLDPGYEDLSDVVTYDPAKAKELLAEAGVKNLTLTLTIPSVYGTTIPTILVSDFNEIGVTLKVDSVEFTSWLQDVYTNKDYDLSFVRHVEARDFSNWANPDYYFNYDNPKVQSLYAEALASTDEAETQKLLAEAARIVSEDHAADWLFLATPIAAVGTNVSGFPENSLNVRLPLAGATVSTE
ncbi:peptide ABC transporter substrate-binding protein [Microbacterium sp. Root61]|uniref:ABC transporter substrate-binding protein n=1 Tax=Microbacterium sp. Root61 TaxID=1736570 RepID=UPI0006FFE4ED|nr:ABC transporter substrate-binding protein [Microbacterium sp. Root61]KRA22319.1 peptide ABC transporter substrate-binding protein [Microbacterium sp. Root61]